MILYLNPTKTQDLEHFDTLITKWMVDFNYTLYKNMTLQNIEKLYTFRLLSLDPSSEEALALAVAKEEIINEIKN